MPQFFSQKYDDIYFSHDDPEAEKQFVFIEANRIAERMASTALSHQDSPTFTVAELGFGFGLNYALTLHAAKEADGLHKLRYFSVEENFPDVLQAKNLGARLKICPTEYEQLWHLSPPEESDSYFPLPLGEGSRVRVGDVLSFLESAEFSADAWYFDGFSPAKNPAMWSSEVFQRAFSLTRPGGTFSTYSAAGWVKRNLEMAGFVVKKTRGFGTKREMLTGFRPLVVSNAEP